MHISVIKDGKEFTFNFVLLAVNEVGSLAIETEYNFMYYTDRVKNIIYILRLKSRKSSLLIKLIHEPLGLAVGGKPRYQCFIYEITRIVSKI